MKTSKTMKVPEITILYETFGRVIEHFETSIKNKDIVDQALENLKSIRFQGAQQKCDTSLKQILMNFEVFIV